MTTGMHLPAVCATDNEPRQSKALDLQNRQRYNDFWDEVCNTGEFEGCTELDIAWGKNLSTNV